MTIIACCDNCDAQNVPGSHYEGGTDRAYGSDTSQCFVCQGDEFDPYGEMDEQPMMGAASE